MKDDKTVNDADRLRYVMTDIDGFANVEKDRYEYAMLVSRERGHGRWPTPDDELEGFRRMIDCALSGGDSEKTKEVNNETNRI